MIAKNIDEVIEILEQIIQETKSAESTLGYFAALYQKVTICVKERLNTNYFDDDERMEKLDVEFANRYLRAYADYKAGKKVTDSWRVAFDMEQKRSMIVLQHLLLGMNAHINLDLGITAARISTGTPMDGLKSDFNKINEILKDLVEEVQNNLAQIWPMLFKLLKFTNKMDDHLVNFSMELARDGAWKFANELHQAEAPAVQEALIVDRDQKVAKLTDLITKRRPMGRILFAFIRLGERGKVSHKISVLQEKLNAES
ncbi:MAG: DUF5995 family protein [Saprospiraceae bacterium]